MAGDLSSHGFDLRVPRRYMPRMAGKTLYDKIWDAHVVAEEDGETILYIDLHLIHEVTTPQALTPLLSATSTDVAPLLGHHADTPANAISATATIVVRMPERSCPDIAAMSGSAAGSPTGAPPGPGGRPCGSSLTGRSLSGGSGACTPRRSAR